MNVFPREDMFHWVSRRHRGTRETLRVGQLRHGNPRKHELLRAHQGGNIRCSHGLARYLISVLVGVISCIQYPQGKDCDWE